MSEAADNLGIPNSTLQRWVKQTDVDDRKAKKGEYLKKAYPNKGRKDLSTELRT